MILFKTKCTYEENLVNGSECTSSYKKWYYSFDQNKCHDSKGREYRNEASHPQRIKRINRRYVSGTKK